jgi:hypothetical protein
MGVRSPSFGVEGRHYDIFVQLVGGDTPLQLTHHKSGDGVPGPPQWSPDGREIAFARCNSERDRVYTVPALGGPERRLTNSPCRDWVAGRPIWTPDNKAMVMLDQCAPGGPRGVVLFSFATGEKRCLAPGSSGDFATDDALSPDGRTVAFSHQTDATYGELYVVPLSGEGPRRLVSAGTHFWNLMWTPDGKYIVAYSNRGNMVRAWRVPVAGGPVEPEMVYPGVGSISQDVGLPMQSSRRGVLPVPLFPRQSGERIFRRQAGQHFVQGSSSIHSSWKTLPNPPRTGRVLRCNQHVPAQTRFGSTALRAITRCN